MKKLRCSFFLQFARNSLQSVALCIVFLPIRFVLIDSFNRDWWLYSVCGRSITSHVSFFCNEWILFCVALIQFSRLASATAFHAITLVPSSFDGVTPTCSSFACDVSARQVLKVPQSVATAQRWRTCEYPIFTASHFLPLRLSIWFSTRVCHSFLFQFFSDVSLCLNYSTACFLFFISRFFFFFSFISFKTKYYDSHDDLVSAVMIDDLLFRPTTNAIRLSVSICIMLLSQLHFASFFLYFILSVTVSTLSIQVRGEMSFYFRTPLLLGRAFAV